MSVSAICWVLHITVVDAAATFPRNPDAVALVLHLTAGAVQRNARSRFRFLIACRGSGCGQCRSLLEESQTIPQGQLRRATCHASTAFSLLPNFFFCHLSIDIGLPIEVLLHTIHTSLQTTCLSGSVSKVERASIRHDQGLVFEPW